MQNQGIQPSRNSYSVASRNTQRTQAPRQAVQRALENLSHDLQAAVLRRNTLVGLLKTCPERVSSEMLSTAREQMEACVIQLLAHKQNPAVQTQGIISLCDSISHFRDLENLRNAAQVENGSFEENGLRANLGLALSLAIEKIPEGENFAPNETEIIKTACLHFENQILHLETARSLSQSPSQQEQYKQEIKGLLISHFNLANAWCMLNCVKLSYLSTPERQAFDLGCIDEFMSKNLELGGLITSLVQHIKYSAGLLDQYVDSSISNRELHATQVDDYLANMATLMPGIRNHALNLANAYFQEMSKPSEPNSTRSPEREQLRQECLNDGLTVALQLVDISHKTQSINDLQANISLSANTAHRSPIQSGKALNSVRRANTAPSRLALLAEQSDRSDESDSSEEEIHLQKWTRTSPPLSLSQKLEHRTQAALNTEVFPSLKCYFHPKGKGSFLPETVLSTLRHELTQATDVQKKLSKLLDDPNLPPERLEPVNAKIAAISQSIAQVTQPALRHDLLKTYQVPQGAHWLELIKAGEIQSISGPRKLKTDEGEGLYEFSIQAKPTSDGEIPAPVWLHIHTHKPVSGNKRTLLWKAVLGKHEHIRVAHLKSDYYRGKGREWEKQERLEGKFESLVKRSPVPMEFIEAIARHYSSISS